MNNKSYIVNSKLMPAGFPRQFDAHIYFTESNREQALALKAEMTELFAGQEVFVGQMIPEAIGPHPSPMFEINFPKAMFADVVLALMHRRKDLSILVHELTGDDLYDHTQAAFWLGTEVPLKYSVLKKS